MSQQLCRESSLHHSTAEVRSAQWAEFSPEQKRGIRAEEVHQPGAGHVECQRADQGLVSNTRVPAHVLSVTSALPPSLRDKGKEIW